MNFENFIEEIKKSIKHKRYSTGRLLDMYNDKNAKNKSEKYRELLKHEKSQNSLFLGGVLLSIEVVLFCLLLFTITKITTNKFGVLIYAKYNNTPYNITLIITVNGLIVLLYLFINIFLNKMS